MAYDFGNSDAHANYIHFGDLAIMDAPSSYTAASWVYINTTPSGGNRMIIAKRAAGVGWRVQVNTSRKLQVYHEDGGGSGTSTESDTAISTGTWHHVVITWDGSDVKYYLDGVADGSQSFSQAIDANSVNVTIGGDTNSNGLAARIGHMMYWDAALSATESPMIYGGMVPRVSDKKFWVPGIVDPDTDYIGQVAGTKSGTVTIAEDANITWIWPFEDDADVGTVAGAAPATLQIGDTPVLELDLPGGTKYYGSAETNALGLSNYQGKLLTWGQVSNGITETSNALQRVDTTVTIDNNDKEFDAILEGASGHQVRGSAARLKILGDGLDPYTRLTGRLDSWSQPEPHRIALNLRPNDTPLERKFPKVRITQFDWPNVSPEALALYAPIIYGYHSSVGDTDEGMVPTFYVNTSDYVYLVAFGYLKEVTNVYVDGTKQTSGYSITNPEVNGKQFTCIDFDADKGTSVVTADVQGYENAGNGTGTLITSPVKQKEHVLENFIYGDYQTGTWLTGNAPIDDSTFASSDNFMIEEGYEGSIRIANNQIKGRSFVDSWLKSWEMRAYWTREGNIAIVPLDHREKDLVISSPWIRWEQEEMGFKHNVGVTGIVDRITGRHVKNSVDDQLKQSLEVRDPSIDEEAAESLDMEYGAARLA